MSPSLTVIVPARNAMPFLAETVDSIFAQKACPIQLLLVDDGSTDGTVEFVSQLGSPEIKVLSLGGLGPSAARNAGIRAAQSDLLVFVDADDIWPPGALAALLAALDRDPSAQFARGRIRNFRGSTSGERRFITPPYRFINVGSCLWRRSLFDQIGMFDEDLRLCEDLDLMLRCWENDIPKIEIDDVVLHYRRHPASMTHGLRPGTFGTLQGYKKHLERIRSGAFDPNAPRIHSYGPYMGTPPQDQDGN
jgi:glycosyltransferase involved in cell wall biosynthesis